MKLRTRIAAAVPLLVVLPLAACSPGTSEPSTTSANLALFTDPTGFDPALARITDDFYVDRMLYDTLLRRDDAGALAPGLASEWEAISASEYVFTIREGATCADGTPITPTVVANSLERFADPETASAGRTQALGDASAEITPDDDANTVTITLSEDWSYLPTGLTLPYTGIVCPAGLADLEGLTAGTVPDASSGPYTITSATPAVGYELALREDYDAWPEFAVPLEGTAPATVTLTPYSDSTTRATQLLSGGIDGATFSDENATRFEDVEGFVSDTVTPMTTYIIFNERAGSVFADAPDLRRAVAQAIDAEAFNDVDSNGRGVLATSVVSPNVPCVNTDTSLLVEYDPDAAADALAGVSIRFVGATSKAPANEYVAEVLRGMGATVALETLDIPNWSTITSGAADWDMTIQGDQNNTGLLVSSLVRVMGPLADEGGRNKTGQFNETGYAALQASAAETNSDDQCAALQEAQESFLERIDAVPLSTSAETSVTTDVFSIRTFGDYIDPATIRVVG